MLFALLVMLMKEMADTTAVVCNHQDTDQRFAKCSNNLSYNPRHIKLGYPVQNPYCDKTLCFFPPSDECLLISLYDANSKKTNIEEAENISTVITNVTSIVAMRLEQRLRFLHTEPPPACIPNSMFARCTFTIFFKLKHHLYLRFGVWNKLLIRLQALILLSEEIRPRKQHMLSEVINMSAKIKCALDLGSNYLKIIERARLRAHGIGGGVEICGFAQLCGISVNALLRSLSQTVKCTVSVLISHVVYVPGGIRSPF